MLSMRELLERAQRTPGVTGLRLVLLERRIWFAKLSVVGCLVVAVIDGRLAGFVGEASWPLAQAAAFGDPAGRAELLALLDA